MTLFWVVFVVLYATVTLFGWCLAAAAAKGERE